MNSVWIVLGFRAYGDSWIEDIFDSKEKADNYILNREIRIDPIEDNDLMFMLEEREVK